MAKAIAKNRLYLLLICLGISVIVMLWDSSDEILTPPKWQDDNQQHFPYAVAKDAATQHYDDSGNIDYSFTASRLEHYRTETTHKNDDVEEYTLISSPHFTIFEQQSPWHLEAEDGKLIRTTQEITLWNNVRIWQTAPPSHATLNTTTHYSFMTELSTNALSINAIEKVARTDEPVKITSPYGEINAVGMTADFQTRKIQLHQRVTAIHRNPGASEETP